MHLHYEIDMILLRAKDGMLWFKMYFGVKLVRGGFVMVSLDYQLDWIENCLGD
jgi:hypothetical protein